MTGSKLQEPIIGEAYIVRGDSKVLGNGVEAELYQQREGTYVFDDGVKAFIVFMGDERLTAESGTIRIPLDRQINVTISGSGSTDLEAVGA